MVTLTTYRLRALAKPRYLCTSKTSSATMPGITTVDGLYRQHRQYSTRTQQNMSISPYRRAKRRTSPRLSCTLPRRLISTARTPVASRWATITTIIYIRRASSQTPALRAPPAVHGRRRYRRASSRLTRLSAQWAAKANGGSIRR